MKQLAINAFEGSWLSKEAKEQRISEVNNYFSSSRL
ncbi:MAG: adenosine deaminase [Flavobacteriales bacterium]